MSEIRETTSIEIEEPLNQQRGPTLAELLAGAGWLAYQGGRLAVKGTIAGAKMAKHALSSEGALTIPAARKIVESSPDASTALRELATRPGMTFPAADATKWGQTLAALSQQSDKTKVLQFAEGMIRLRQDRWQTQTSKLVVEACEAIGFSPKIINGSPGLVTAIGAGTRKVTVEVAKDREGGLRLHFDAHGFHGGECRRVLDALHRELAARGVSFVIDSRRSKDRAPALDVRGHSTALRQCRSRI
jgi:hypothetical protein